MTAPKNIKKIKNKVSEISYTLSVAGNKVNDIGYTLEVTQYRLHKN